MSILSCERKHTVYLRKSDVRKRILPGEIVCANEYVYLGKLRAQMYYILSKMSANVLPP